MKFGFQSIIFGRDILNLEYVLEGVAACGYKGIEFAQSPDRICLLSGKAVTAQELHLLLKSAKLTLLGFAGGSIEERMDFCDGRAYNGACVAPSDKVLNPRYIYVEDCNDELMALATARKFRLALHPHVFRTNPRLSDAKLLLDLYPKLLWMPDTAHLSVAGQDIPKAIRLVPVNRMAALHLKNWDAACGRSYHRYAKGFTEFDHDGPRGEFQDSIIDLALKTLEEIHFDGWVVVEQDYARIRPLLSARQNAKWLRDAGYKFNIKSDKLTRLEAKSDGASSRHPALATTAFQSAYSNTLLNAVGEDLHECYHAIAETLCQISASGSAALWSYSPSRQNTGLLAFYKSADGVSTGSLDGVLPSTLDKTVLGGPRLDGLSSFSLAVTDPDLLSSSSLGARQFRSFIAADGVDKIHVLPITNRYNSRHVRFVATFFGKANNKTKPLSDRLSRSQLHELTWQVACVADASLDERCAYAAGKVTMLAAKHSNVDPFLKDLVTEIQKIIPCQGLTIFLADNARMRLEERASTGITWSTDANEKYYPRDDQVTWTGRAWTRNEPQIAQNALDGYHRSTESGPRIDPSRGDLLLVPLVRPVGDVLGVIRCRNKTSSDYFNGRRMSWAQSPSEPGAASNIEFTDDDTAILDAMGQAAASHIHTLSNDILRVNAIRKLTHELLMPVTAVSTAVDLMAYELNQRFPNGTYGIFRYDYPRDALMWTDVMARLVGNLDFYARADDAFDLECKPTCLFSDVIAPAIDSVSALLRKRGFDASRIDFRDNFADIPNEIHVDPPLFQQVVYNLLSNAIKFAFPDPSLFSIKIYGRRPTDSLMLTFEDSGPGIAEGDRELIFEDGRRGKDAASDIRDRPVIGQGLGLPVVQRTVRAHGGSVFVSSLCNPTAITIQLPLSLETEPPPSRGQK